MAKASRVAAQQARAMEILAAQVEALAADLKRVERKLDAMAKALKEGAG